MKLLYSSCIVMVCLLFVSCGPVDSRTEKKTEVIEKPVFRKMGATVQDIFFVKHTNVATNDLVKEKALKEFMHQVDSLVPLHYLEDIPLKVFAVQKNPHGKGALVQFYTDNELNRDGYPNTNLLGFDIIGFMSEELASTIDDTKKYYVYAHNYKRLNYAEVSVLVDKMYHGTTPRVSTGTVRDDEIQVIIGNFACEVDSIAVVQ